MLNKRCASKGPLDEKTRQLITIVTCAMNKSEGGVKTHTKYALEAGASPDEVRQAVLTMMGPAGFSVTRIALDWVNEVLSK